MKKLENKEKFDEMIEKDLSEEEFIEKISKIKDSRNEPSYKEIDEENNLDGIELVQTTEASTTEHVKIERKICYGRVWDKIWYTVIVNPTMKNAFNDGVFFPLKKKMGEVVATKMRSKSVADSNGTISLLRRVINAGIGKTVKIF